MCYRDECANIYMNISTMFLKNIYLYETKWCPKSPVNPLKFICSVHPKLEINVLSSTTKISKAFLKTQKRKKNEKRKANSRCNAGAAVGGAYVGDRQPESVRPRWQASLPGFRNSKKRLSLWELATINYSCYKICLYFIFLTISSR